jgi:hypothetical protein
MSEVVTKPGARVQRAYDEEEITRGLAELARAGGNERVASERLAELGYDIPRSTLSYWRRVTKRDRYIYQAEMVARQVEESVVHDMRENLILAAEAERAALEATLDQINSGNAKDPSGIARNVSTTKGINLTHLLTYTGRPNQIVEHRSAQETLDNIARMVPNGVIEADHEEIHDADIVSQNDETPP